MAKLTRRLTLIRCCTFVVMLTCLTISTSANAQSNTQVKIDARRAVGPKTLFFGWDLKGYPLRVNSTQRARVYYEQTPANMIRIPFFATAHTADGKLDEERYAKIIRSLQNIKAVKADVKVFASLRLDGKDTFPAWMTSQETGKIFNSKVKRPAPEKFSDALVAYVKHFASNDIKIDCLGIINEVEYALSPAEYIQTIRLLRTKLKKSGLDEQYRSMIFVGPETFKVTPAAAYTKEVIKLGGKDTIQIGGAHMYPNGHYEKGDVWDQFKRALPNKVPMWHTEAHLGKHSSFEGHNNVTLIRNAFAVLGGANREGVSGYIWWNNGHASDSVSQTSKRLAIQAMLGSTQVAVLPRHPIQMKLEQPGDVYQAYRNGNTLHVFLIHNDASKINDFQVELKSEQIQKILVAESYHSPGDKIGEDASKVSLESKINKEEKGLTITELPAHSFTYLQLELKSKK